MPLLLWDASALSQRYAPETGSATVDALLRDIPAARHIVSVLAYAETCSVLLRKLNRGDIGIRTYRAARGMLRREAAEGREFVPLSIDDAAVFSGLELMDRHRLNASDSAILAGYLTFAAEQPPPGGICAVIASDRRFLRAARAEGLRGLDPEVVGDSQVNAALAGT